MEKEVSIAHFTMKDLSTGEKTGTVAGVEAVMKTQKDILKQNGWNVETVVGDGEHEEGVVIYEPIRSGYWAGHDENFLSNGPVTQIMSELTDMLGDKPIIAHNTTNAARHNPPFGDAMAKLAEKRIDEGSSNIILWSHDARNASLDAMNKYIPHRKEAKIVCVSRTREEELMQRFDEVRQSFPGTQLPEDIRVIYNPINPMYLKEDIPSPTSLHQLAPNFEHFTREHHLNQSFEDIEKILFDEDPEIRKFIVPARIVAQKGIQDALSAASEYAQRYGKQTAFIVTGPPDIRKPENAQYWSHIKDSLVKVRSPRLKTAFLGGVATEYMPWLFKGADDSHYVNKLVLLPSNNEGFGLPPSEAACLGTPSVLSDIPAFAETTHGNALLLSLEEWKNPSLVADKIADYIASGKPQHDAQELNEVARKNYAPEVISQQLEDILLS